MIVAQVGAKINPGPNYPYFSSSRPAIVGDIAFFLCEDIRELNVRSGYKYLQKKSHFT